MHTNRRSAFTLMELLVVISIMALVALVAIPKLSDVLDRSRSGVAAYSLADVARMIETFNAMERKYPDGFDLLISATDNSSLETSIINPALAASLSTTTLSDAQVLAFSSAGIGHIFTHVDTTDSSGALLYMPSDTGRTRHHLGTGAGHDGTPNVNTVAIINPASATGQTLLLNDLNVVQNKDASADAAAIANTTFVVLGVGPRCTLVQKVIQDAPIFDSANPVKYYSRALAVFSVPNNPGINDKARLIGVVGPDGRGKATNVANYNNVALPH